MFGDPTTSKATAMKNGHKNSVETSSAESQDAAAGAGATTKPSGGGNTSGSDGSSGGDKKQSLMFTQSHQLPNKIRRLRSRHAKLDRAKLWFYGANPWSFNSRCSNSKRFDVNDLDDEARQYYYFRSLPRVAPLTAASPNDMGSLYLAEPPEAPSTPPAQRAARERAKYREQMLL